jgi:16S rRNA U516 pseudouridylate synthase RsuA-like enzyme
MRSLLVTTGLLLLTTSQALAVDLVNKDNKPYQVFVTSARGTITVLIQPLSVAENICTEACQIRVKTVGTVEAAYNTSIKIENGKLIRE